MRLSSKTLTGVLHAQNKGCCDWGYQGKIAYGCQNIVVVVDPKTVQVVQSLDRHKGYVVKVKWAHENYHHDQLNAYSLRLASADFNGRIIVWDVTQATIKAEFSDGSKPVSDMEWIKNSDVSHDLLAVLHPPYSLILWNADTGTKIWKKSYTESIQSFSFDPFDAHKLAFLGTDCIMFVDDFTLNKVPSSNGKKFYISSPSAQGGGNGSSGNDKPQERKSSSSKLLGRRVSNILIGESSKRAGDDDNMALNECLQLTYHKACRGHLILLYPREILILDLDINQTVGIVPMERAGSPFVQVMSMSQRDVLMCLHENGGVTLRVRRRNQVSTPSPEQVSTFGTQEDSPINTSSLDVTYDLKCQSDALRITKYNKLYGVVVCPVSDLQVALVMSDSRVLIWQLKSIDKQPANTYMSGASTEADSPSTSSQGLNLCLPNGITPPRNTLNSLIGHSSTKIDSSVLLNSVNSQRTPASLKFILIGLLSGVAPPPFVIRMCPPLTTKNWNVYQPLLALGTNSGTLQVFNLSSAAIWREYNIHTCAVRGIEWVSLHSFVSYAYPNPGPSNLVKNELIVTDTLTGKTTILRQNREEESPIEMVKISYLKQYFVLVFKDKPFELWDLRIGTLLRQMPKNFPHVTAMEWSPSHSMKSLKKKLTQEVVSTPAASMLTASQTDSITSSVTTLDPIGRSTPAPPSETLAVSSCDLTRPDTKQLLSSVAAREHFVFTDSDGLLYHFSVEGNVIKEGSKIPPDGGMGSITSIAWKGETMVLGDVDGNLNLWDLKARVSRSVTNNATAIHNNAQIVWEVIQHGFPGDISFLTVKYDAVVFADPRGFFHLWGSQTNFHRAVPTHRGWIKKLKFAPGRGNMKLLVLYNDGVDIWDAKDVELVSSVKSPRDIAKVTDADWAASDKPVLACADGCVRIMDLKMRVGSAAMEEYQLVETMFSPHTLEPKESLTLKYLLQHQPWRGSYQLKLDDAAENMSENLVNIVNEQLEFLDSDLQEYLPSAQFGTAERCLLTAQLFGDESEITFWTVALHYLRSEKYQPMNKSLSRPSIAQTDSSGDLFVPSGTPGSRESSDLLDFGEASQKENKESSSVFRVDPLETCFDILCDSHTFQKGQLDRIALHDNKRVTYEHTRRCAENLMLLGQADRAVQLLLETEAENDQYYVDNLRACLVASIRSSGASQSTIKLVATNLIASGKLSEGVQLLCLIDKGLDACRYLQTYGQWYQAAWLAKATLSYPECTEVMKRWADHMSSALVNQKSRAVLVMLSLGHFMKALELLYAMRQFDRAALFIEACNEFGLLDKNEDSNPLIEAVFLEYARHMINLGNCEAAHHYCHLAGEKGNQLQKELENIFSTQKKEESVEHIEKE